MGNQTINMSSRNLGTVDMQNQNGSSRRKFIIIIIALALTFLVVDVLFIYSSFNQDSNKSLYASLKEILMPEEASREASTPDEDDKNKPIEPSEPVMKRFNETPVTDGGHFFELTPTIGTQQAYIAHPIEIDPANPPTIIVYSHGSITFITKDFTDPFMLDMRAYGEFFTANNYIFAASNEHGENWGNAQSVEDIRAMVEWIQTAYDTQPEIYMTGHSMGGLPTFEYAFAYPDTVAKIGLLAPTTRPTIWTAAELALLNPMDVKIWHGEKDVNVGSFLSVNFKTAADAQGNLIDLVLIPDGDHWSVDTELKDELLEFFEE